MRRFDKKLHIQKVNKKLLIESMDQDDRLRYKFAELAKQYGVQTISSDGEGNPITPEIAYRLLDKKRYNSDLIDYLDKVKEETGKYEALEDNLASNTAGIGGYPFKIENHFDATQNIEFNDALRNELLPMLGEAFDGERHDYDYVDGDSYFNSFKDDEVGMIDELSGQTFMDASNQAMERKQYARIMKLGELYLHKYKGVEICGGVIEEATVGNNSDSMRAMLWIRVNGTKYVNLYDITNDEWHIRTPEETMDRRSARALSKLSLMFNPESKYANFMDKFRIVGVHETAVVKPSIAEGMINMFNKVCGVKLIKESSDDTYFETLSSTLDKVRGTAEQLGYTLDEEEVNLQFGSGGISYEQTKQATIPLLKNGQPIVGKSGKPLNRSLRVAIYRMSSGMYELTCYKTW